MYTVHEQYRRQKMGRMNETRSKQNDVQSHKVMKNTEIYHGNILTSYHTVIYLYGTKENGLVVNYLSSIKVKKR